MAEFDFDSQPDVSADDVLSVAEASGSSLAELAAEGKA